MYGKVRNHNHRTLISLLCLFSLHRRSTGKVEGSGYVSLPSRNITFLTEPNRHPQCCRWCFLLGPVSVQSLLYLHVLGNPTRFLPIFCWVKKGVYRSPLMKTISLYYRIVYLLSDLFFDV